MRANISIFSMIRNTGLLFSGMILTLGIALFFPDPSFSQEKKQDKLIRFYAYRLIVAKPYLPVTTKPQEGIANFNSLKVKPSLSAYVKWQFFEGKKKVLATGIGAEYQKDLLWKLNSGDTVLNSRKLFSADVFFDTLNKEIGTSLNIYAAAFLHDYGPGYLRNLGINNMANGMERKIVAFNGAGNID